MKAHRLANRLMVLTIFLAILATVQGTSDSQIPKYCTNEKCRTVAYEIVRSQNRSVKPCDDFYEHVCSGEKGYNFFYTSMKIHDEITESLRNIQPSDMETLKKAKTFHESCMDQDAIKRRGLTPIATILSDNGEWPVTVPSDKWNNQRFRWQEIHENLFERTGISGLFDISVEIDRFNPAVHILSLGVPTIPSQREYLIPQTGSEKRAYLQYKKYLSAAVKKIKKIRGFDVSQADVNADCDEIIAFEDKLDKFATIVDEDGIEKEDDVRVTTIETLQNEWDAVVPRDSDYSINWLSTINRRFEGTGIVVDASEKIALKPASLISNLARTVVNTPLRTIVNYIHWKVVDKLIPITRTDISNPHSKAQFAAMTTAGVCINHNKMTHAIAYMYVKEHFSLQSKTAALEMVRNVQEEMKREISESSWLDESAKSVARKKIDAMTNSVGYPDWYDVPGKLDEYYRELTVGLDYFANHLAFYKFEVKKKMSSLRSPVDDNESVLIAMPHIVNAEYLERWNSMSLPAAILRLPFFSYDIPSVLNYAAIGSFVGHEIGHGFDTKGRLYDADGIKRQWWSQSMIDEYKSKAQCFIKQYDNYTALNTKKETVHLNGTETQRENIADTIGFRAGLRAYQRLRNNGKTNNLKIQLLRTFTDEQLYFYRLTHTLCKPGETYTQSSEGMNTHSPARSRIIGSFSNMQEFADAFHCPLGSPMNPSEKCVIWD